MHEARRMADNLSEFSAQIDGAIAAGSMVGSSPGMVDHRRLDHVLTRARALSHAPTGELALRVQLCRLLRDMRKSYKDEQWETLYKHATAAPDVFKQNAEVKFALEAITI